jgi:hypothetical protein
LSYTAKNILFIIIVAFLFNSCGSGKSAPLVVVGEFTEALERFDFRKAREMVTTNYLPSLEGIEKVKKAFFQKGERPKKGKYNYKLISRTDNTATVSMDSEAEKIHIDFYLKKKNGDWLIDSQKIAY